MAEPGGQDLDRAVDLTRRVELVADPVRLVERFCQLATYVGRFFTNVWICSTIVGVTALRNAATTLSAMDEELVTDSPGLPV